MNKKLLVSLIPILIFLPLFFILISSMSAQTDPPLRSPDLIVELYEGDPMSRYINVPSSNFEVIDRPQSPVFSGPSWSIIGYESFANYNWDIYTLNADSLTPKRITKNESTDSYPSINFGGNFILFSSNRSGNNDIYKANADGTNAVQLTSHGASETFPVWSPDGSRIAFQSNQFGNVDIFVMNADGSNIQRLTVSNAYDGMPSWSPDGSKIVFSSNRNGVYQLWIMNADGSNQRLLNSINPAFFPAWSPDGKAIAFSHDSDLNGFLEIWIVEADGKNPQGFYAAYPGSNRDVWLPTWSPDGKSLGATITSWININGKWYWTGSSFYNIEIMFGRAGSVYPLINDNRVWKAHWASIDTEPPGVCTVTAPFESRWATVNLQLDAQDAQSDILSYEMQVRLNGGTWNTVVYDGGAPRRVFFQGTDGIMEFRCRAKDWSGNVRDWTDAPIVQTMIDATWPTSSISTERLVQGNHVAVNWSGSDKGMGVAGYDIYVKEAGNGNWSLWQENTVNTTAVYTGTVGSTYYFRSQATDGVGHVEVWQPSPEATVTFYAQVISGTLTDNRGMPIVAIPVLTPTGGVDASIGSYRAYTSSALTHTLSLSASGYETFPPTDFSTTSDTQFDVVLGPSTNVLVNGGMESGDLTGWVVSGSGVSAVNTPYSGGYGMQLSGITAVSQTVSVPNAMNQPTLSLMYQLPSDLSSGNLRVQVSGTTTTTVLNTAAAAPDWTHVWADLSPYAGQTITLSVSLDAPTGTAVLDAFSIGPWETPAILSVSPTEVQPGDTITVTGDNFINTPSLFINEIEVGSVQWISSTQLTAVLPNSVDLGTYDVKVINPSGSEIWMTDALTITRPTVMLPVILNDSSGYGTPMSQIDGANWLTLGYDPAHTSHHLTDSGGANFTLVWSRPLLSFPTKPMEQIAIADGIVVAASNSDSQAIIVGLDAYTGQELWQLSFASQYINGQYTVNPPTIANGFVYFSVKEFSADSSLYSLDLYSGEQIWQLKYWNYASEILAPIVVGDKIYIGGLNSLHIAGAVSGEPYWYVTNSYSAVNNKWTPSYANNKIYSWVRGNFYENDPESGKMLWNLVDVDSDIGDLDEDTAPVISGKIALVVSMVKLAAIDLATHQIAWSVAGNYDQTIPAVADDVVYAIGNGELEARRLTDGALLWSFAGDGALTNAPIVAGIYVYVASNNNTYVLNRNTHQLVWTTAHGGWLSLANGYLYIAQPDNTIYAYRAESE